MKKKINWGTGILITFILFMASVLIQVFFYMNTDVDLVTDNYYEKELSYEEHLTKVRNSANLISDVDINYTGNEINITFPEGYSYDKIKGSLLFYRPSDPSKDFTVSLQPDQNRVQRIVTKDIDSGYWKIKMNWSDGNSSYYFEEAVLIN